MKVGRGAPAEVKGRHREATDCAKVVNGLIKKYGYELTRYVSSKLLEGEREKRRLQREVTEAKKQLRKLEAEKRRARRR